MSKSKIEWTETTWNPTTGCTKISNGCKNCYAERMAKRLHAMGVEKYKNNFDITLHPAELKIPYKWRKPRLVFVNSMSDLFHKDIPLDFIKKVFKVMNDNPLHTFQVLTKRSDILFKYKDQLTWSKNIWMGVTIEEKKYLSRLDHLKETNAKIKFISIEPLIGEIGEIDLTGVHWVIVGGESGPKSRPIEKKWVREIRDQCIQQKVSFFFKQWGGTNKKKTGRILDGKIWDQMPNKT